MLTTLASFAGAAQASAATDTFAYTGGSQLWTVPSGVISATFDLYGAAGGTSQYGTGGLGGRATATLAVTPGDSIQIEVGQNGQTQLTYDNVYNGGAGGLVAGGGATDVRIGGSTLNDRVLVAGGGGGAGGGCTNGGPTPNGGTGGGLTGGSSANSCRGVPTTGGTQTEGGQNIGNGGATRGSPGGFGYGAPGLPSATMPEAREAGGGGGGWYGGGGGFEGSGGGGGSGHGPAGTVFENGVRAGNGLATVTYTLPHALDVSATGNGYVDSSPAGIDCGSGAHTTCATDVPHATDVTLTAHPDTGWDFTGWSGGSCSGSASTCTVTMDQARTVDATFALQMPVLSVVPSGTGSGKVTSSPGGIDCGLDCGEAFAYGTPVTLTAAPDPGTDFTGWSGGGCTGPSTTCTVTMDQARSVTADFALQTPALTAGRSGNGSGSVASSPAGIDCGADCSESYDYGTPVTLTAVPETGSSFTGWSGGGCTGTGACTVTMDQARSVTAGFTLQTRHLAVSRTGDGQGSISSSPAGIDCGSDCGQDYDYGTPVTLTATAAAGSSFTGWSGGGCSGGSTCTLNMDQARSATATFISDPVPPDEGPRITSLAVTPKAFQASDDSTPLTRARKGARIEITLSEGASVRFRVKNGKPSGDGTAPPPPPERPRTFDRGLGAGKSTVAFSGRLVERRLEPGRYRLVARATDSAGQLSEKVTARFRVLP